ncbi:MAG: hypothetical protein RIS91_277 [Bacteroidota bacterium]|jgi:translation initiation factor IF-2
MGWAWLKKIIIKFAAEVHKSKIAEFEKRILEIEKNQTLILKTIQDNQAMIDKIEDRVYKANLESASAVGAIKTLIQMGNQNNNFTPKGNSNNE